MTGIHPEVIQKSIKSCLIRTKYIPITQRIPGNFRTLLKTRVKDQMLEQDGSMPRNKKLDIEVSVDIILLYMIYEMYTTNEFMGMCIWSEYICYLL